MLNIWCILDLFRYSLLHHYTTNSINGYLGDYHWNIHQHVLCKR